MGLPIDTDSYDYKFNKTLNEDVHLVSDEYGKYDLDMFNGDYVNIIGVNSLRNACIIAILTRYGELKDNPTYELFGCRVHELIKDNQTKMTQYKIETFIVETLNKMRRIKTVDDINILKKPGYYDVRFQVTSINDETVKGSVML